MGTSHCDNCTEHRPQWTKAGKLLNRAVQIVIAAIVLFAIYHQFIK